MTPPAFSSKLPSLSTRKSLKRLAIRVYDERVPANGSEKTQHQRHWLEHRVPRVKTKRGERGLLSMPASKITSWARTVCSLVRVAGLLRCASPSRFLLFANLSTALSHFRLFSFHLISERVNRILRKFVLWYIDERKEIWEELRDVEAQLSRITSTKKLLIHSEGKIFWFI